MVYFIITNMIWNLLAIICIAVSFGDLTWLDCRNPSVDPASAVQSSSGNTGLKGNLFALHMRYGGWVILVTSEIG